VGNGKGLAAELYRLQTQLVELQRWVRDEGQRLVIVFEGRDAAGKGGLIKRITEYLNPRWCRIAALPAPSDREKTEWYFQRYVRHLPAAGEIVVFDRSWYNRAGVERVMGFCTEPDVERFFRQCPAFERMLLDDGIILVKYWLSVSAEEQERRFQERAVDPMKRWKLSNMDIEGRARWDAYSRAKDDMFAHCDTPDSPWWTVESDSKQRARINCIAHLLSVVPARLAPIPPVELPGRPASDGYERAPRHESRYVPDHSASLDRIRRS
jgi:polyphosphate kinase